MASDAALLAKVDTTIENLLDAIGDTTVEEYEIGGRKIRRVDFSRALDSLMKQRQLLRNLVARASRSPVRVVKMGNRRAVDR